MNNVKKYNKIKRIVLLIGFLIFICAYAFSPYAYVNFGGGVLTVILIPIVLALLLFDNVIYTIIIGIAFGCTTLISANMYAIAPQDLYFKDPVIAIVPRVLMALITVLVFDLLKKKMKIIDKISAFMCSLIATIIGVAANTYIAITFLVIKYGDKLGCDTTMDKVNYTFTFLIGLNPLLELLFVSIIVASLYLFIKTKTKSISNEIDDIKNLFKKWLLVVVTSSFFATYYLAFCATTYYAKNNATATIELNIEDIKEAIGINFDKMKDINDSTKDTLVDKAHAISLLVAQDPTLLTKKDGLKNLAYKIGVNEMSFVAEDGIVDYSYPDVYVGLDTSKYKDLEKYNGLIDGTITKVAEDSRLNVGDEKEENPRYQMFAGVPRLDKKGYVQVTFSDAQYNRLASTSSIVYVAKTVRIGNEGGVFVTKDYNVLSANDDGLINIDISSYKDKIENCMKTKKGFIDYYDDIQYYLYAKEMGEYILIGYMPLDEVYTHRNIQCVFLLVCDALLFIIIYILILRLMDKMVVCEVNKINESLEKITEGDLTTVVDVRSTSEFNALSDDINATVDSLKELISAEKKRINTDLELARAIQISALPNVFPAFPNRDEFDIYARMDTAKEVGGDFYDYFFISHTKLVFLIADVSGKGIPAAMFMMRAKAIIKSLAERELPLNKVVEETNRLLYENNEMSMFVTAWVAMLDTDTKEVTYVNCGHNPPLYVKRDGEIIMLKDRSGFILGSMPDMKYKEYNLQLEEGDMLYLYTDGVTESINSSKEMYGENRLIARIDKNRELELKDILKSVKDDIDVFAGDEEQFDDITMVALSIPKEEKKGKVVNDNILKIDNDSSKLNDIFDFINKKLEKYNVSAKVRNDIEVSVEEIFVNITSYAYGDNKGEVVIKNYIERNDAKGQNEWIMQFRDKGVPYNPLEKKDPDITLSAAERKIGGLGIFLVKKMMNDLSYTYDEKTKENVLTLMKVLD